MKRYMRDTTAAIRLQYRCDTAAIRPQYGCDTDAIRLGYNWGAHQVELVQNNETDMWMYKTLISCDIYYH